MACNLYHSPQVADSPFPPSCMSSSARIDELRRKFDENPRRYFAPLANEYRKVGDFDQAIFICQEYLPQQPGHMSGHIVFGQALFEAKRLAEARTVFETALTLDPENLIALRHLADISRDLGETTAARAWYERVLQADPRNEEIAAIMSAMPAADLPAAAPAADAVEPVVQDTPPSAGHAGSPSAPTVELSAAAVQELLRERIAARQQEASAAPQPTLNDLQTVERRAVPSPAPAMLEGLETTTHEATPDAPSGGLLGLEPTETVGAGSPPTGLDAITLDDFSLPAGSPVQAADVAPSSPATLDFGAFGFAGDAPPAPPTIDIIVPVPESQASVVAAAGPEAASDFEFDIPPAQSAPAVTPPEAVPTIVMDALDDAGRAAVDLDVIPGAVDPIVNAAPLIPDLAVMDAVVELPPAEVESVRDIPTVVMEEVRIDPAKSAIRPVLETKPSIVTVEPTALDPTEQINVAEVMEQISASRQPQREPEAPAERQTPAFVTETMAQLYLGQGHRAEAIDIYRQLVEARPADAELRARLEAIERGSGSDAPRADKEAQQAPVAGGEPALAGGQSAVAQPRRKFAEPGLTIRTVLRDLFGIDGVSANGGGNGSGDGQGETGSIDILFSVDSVTADLGPLASAFDGGYVASSGSIDAVFAVDSQ